MNIGEYLINKLSERQQLPLANNGGVLIIEEVPTPVVKEKTTKKEGFGVLVDGLPVFKPAVFLSPLLSEIKSYPELSEHTKACWGRKRVKSANYGEVIIFGDAPSGFKYDYRLETDLTQLDKSMKIYSLAVEFDEIRKALKKYVKANYPKPVTTNPLKVNVNLQINVVAEPVKEKKSKWHKVQVFYNYVKIGWDQYDIWVDKKGKEYIIINDTVIRVKRDINGNGYLEV